jgi:predicted MFS family arabinose efflux permease
MALLVLVHLAFTGARVALALFAISLHAPTVVVGLLASLLSLLPMLLSVRLGRWIDQVGLKRPARVAICLAVVGTVLPAVWPTVPALCLSSMLLGSGFMLLHMTVFNEVGHVTTDANRVRAYMLLALAFSLSTVLGPVIAGVSIDLVGHRLTFALMTLFPLAALALVLWLRIRMVPRTGTRQAATGQVRDLLALPRLRAVLVVSGLLSMAWDMFTFMVPVQGARIGLSASTIGMVMGSFGVATLIVRVAMPALHRHLSEWQTLVMSLSITAVVYLLFPLTTSVPVLLALAFVNGLSLGCTQPMVMSLVHSAAPPGRSGEALGVRSTIMNASQVFLPILFGGLGSAAGLGPAFWVLAGMLSGGALYARRFSRTH